MADAFDTRLSDPTAANVAVALRRACAANGTRKTAVVKLAATTQKSLAERVGREAEGVYFHRGKAGDADAGRLLLAWRTDSGGRKRVRVRAWRVAPNTTRRDWKHASLELDERELTARPPLWHLDPHAVYEFDDGIETRWLCACRCGAVGTAESLGWADGLCGPCSDRVAEFGPTAVPPEPVSFLSAPRFSPSTVEFGPDDARVSGTDSYRTRFWERTTGRLLPEVVPQEPGGNPFINAISPDRTRAVRVERWQAGAEVEVLDLSATEATLQNAPVVRTFRLGYGPVDRTGGWWGSSVSAIRFTPDGERVLFACNEQLELWHLDRHRALHQAVFPVNVWTAAFTPDYEHLLVLGGDGWLHVCHPGVLNYVKARLRWHLDRPTGLAVSSDGTTLATAGDDGVKLWPLARLLDALRGYR